MSPPRLLMLMGVLLFAAGAAWWLAGRVGGAGYAGSWIGRLPGDIRVAKPNYRFYFPLTTCLLASLALTALLWLLQRWRR